MADETKKVTRTRKPRTTKAKSETSVKRTAKTKTTNAADVAEVKEAKEVTEVELLKEQIELLKAQLATQNNVQPQVVQIAGDTAKVTFLWQAEVADDNETMFGTGGMYGRIVGKTGSFYIPKSDLSRILDATNRYYLDKRWLIVVSGLDEEEREALGVNYKEGELLDKKAFAKMVEIGWQMVDIYPQLCDSHKEMVAKRFYEDFRRTQKADRELIIALNRIEQQDGFKKIIEELNEKDLK